VFGAIAAIAVVLAVATVWLFLTSPVTVANAVNEGAIRPSCAISPRCCSRRCRAC
jgi:hypothetical protein